MKTTDCWNPSQYKKFESYRDQPFYDLLDLITNNPDMIVADLGCGTGKLTSVLSERFKAKYTLGIDSSKTMLKEAFTYQKPNLAFELLKIEEFKPEQKYDLIFSNAALQWVPNHEVLIKHLSKCLSVNGQIAIQMPANFDFPTHTIARETAKHFNLREGYEPAVLPVESYSQLFFNLGAKEQQVKMQVYPVVLESTEQAIEWVKGSLLTSYQSRLSLDDYQEFLREYSKNIKNHFGEKQPFFLPFKRLLLWAHF